MRRETEMQNAKLKTKNVELRSGLVSLAAAVEGADFGGHVGLTLRLRSGQAGSTLTAGGRDDQGAIVAGMLGSDFNSAVFTAMMR